MRRSLLIICVLLAAALAMRLLVGWWWQQHLPAGQRFAFGDSESYWALAEAIHEGRPYRYGSDQSRIFRTPGYPLLLATLWGLSDGTPPVYWARAQAALCGTAAVAGVGYLAWRLFDARAALLATGLAAFAPDTVAAGVFVLSEAPFCPLLVLNIICWTESWRAQGGRSAGWALLSGMVAGGATLMRPSWLLFTPFAVGIGLLTGPQRRRQAVSGGIMLAGLVLALLPWWIRNYRIAGEFVPTTLQVGASLYDGWNPRATGGSDMSFVPEFVAEQRRVDAAQQQGGRAATEPQLFEARVDRRLREAALDWARVHPRRVLELALIRIGRIWSPWPHAQEMRSRLLRAAVALGYFPIVVGGIWGAWRFAARGWPYRICWLPAVYFTCLHVIFVGSLRYRQPAMFTLIVLAAGAYAARWEGGRGAESGRGQG